MNLNDFHSLFLVTSNEVMRTETFEEVNSAFTRKQLLIPSSGDFVNALAFLNERDKLKISVIINENESIDFYSSKDADEFLKELGNAYDIKEADDVVKICFTITKSRIEDTISVYDLSVFIKYLLNLELKSILYVLNKSFTSRKYLILESQFEEIHFNTSSIYFTDQKVKVTQPVLPQQLRTDKINLVKTVSHFNLIPQYEFLPEDFLVTESTSPDLSELFNKLTAFYSVAYLYDITTVEAALIEYKLNGYKSITGAFSFMDIDPKQFEEYYKIYEWCYNSGNFTDKIGLARNIISLHLEEKNKIDLKGSPFQSILSSYKVYEKQNIKQYIEIRNKISDQLLSFHDRSDKIIGTFASGFQKSALALISLYISTIALKIITKGELLSAFTLDATILSFAFIFFSFIYYAISVWEVKEQRKRFVNSYNGLKERYTDLLDSNDIQRILNNDKEFSEDLAFIDTKFYRYKIMWIIFLSALAVTTLFLFLINHFSNWYSCELAMGIAGYLFK
jgi:hypothetical protein